MKSFSYATLKLEIKRSFKQNMIWSFALGLSLLAIVAIYPFVKDMMQSIFDFMESMDPSNPFLQIMNEFGGIPTSAIGYFATEGAMILQLVGGIYAATLGYGLINKDERENTHEVLYTLPISKTKLMQAKLAAMFVHIFIFTCIQFALSTIGFIIIDEWVMMDIFWLFGLINFFLFSMIAILALLLALVLKPKQSGLLAVVVPFPFYIMTIIAQATDQAILKGLKYASPFTFADPVGFLKTNYEFNWINMLTFFLFSLLIIFFVIKYYKRREII